MALSKMELLEAVVADIVTCTRCPLWRTRKNAVPGEGNPDASVMLIGEAPGYWEDVNGRPFVGAAGRFLETLLLEVGLLREDVFICNVLKCRPPKNREPSPYEIQTCTPYLDKQIGIVKPKLIVTLGNYSTAYVFSKAGLAFEGITKAHGALREVIMLGMKVAVFPTFHPAAALYSQSYKEQITADFKKLGEGLRRIFNTVS